MKYLLLMVMVIGVATFSRCNHPYKKPPKKFIKEQFGFAVPACWYFHSDTREYNDVDFAGYSIIKYKPSEETNMEVFLKKNEFTKIEEQHIGRNELFKDGYLILENDSVNKLVKILNLLREDKDGPQLHTSYFNVVQTKPQVKVMLYDYKSNIVMFYHRKHL